MRCIKLNGVRKSFSTVKLKIRALDRHTSDQLLHVIYQNIHKWDQGIYLRGSKLILFALTDDLVTS